MTSINHKEPHIKLQLLKWKNKFCLRFLNIYTASINIVIVIGIDNAKSLFYPASDFFGKIDHPESSIGVLEKRLFEFPEAFVHWCFEKTAAPVDSSFLGVFRIAF